jgi:2-amino-4-hydroxy-6-hydroxymethyldihydropteridine diphosphokinase
MSRVVVGLGANLGDPARQVEAAIDALADDPAFNLLARSSLYGSKPWGDTAQPDYVNAVAICETPLVPGAVLDRLFAEEARQGRVRQADRRNGPRVIDLDLLLYDDLVDASPRLELPHPRIRGRAFVLLPLAEIAPDLVIPGLGRVAELIEPAFTAECWRLSGPPPHPTE